jgi:hypothetical protein
MTDDLVSFLRARLEEDQAAAEAAPLDAVECLTSWIDYTNDGGESERAEAHLRRHDPARVLREVEAKRRIVDVHHDVNDGDCAACVVGEWGYPTHGRGHPAPWPCQTVRLLGLPFSDHPDYSPEWFPADDPSATGGAP